MERDTIYYANGIRHTCEGRHLIIYLHARLILGDACLRLTKNVLRKAPLRAGRSWCEANNAQ